MKEGVSEEKLADLPNYAKSAHYDEREKTAIEFGERMTRTEMDVTDEFFKKAQGVFTNEELVEIAGIAAMENFRSKFNNAFRVEAQGFCLIPNTKPE